MILSPNVSCKSDKFVFQSRSTCRVSLRHNSTGIFFMPFRAIFREAIRGALNRSFASCFSGSPGVRRIRLCGVKCWSHAGWNASFVRASISFPGDIYRTLEKITKQKKVLLACVRAWRVEKDVVEKKREIPKQRQD